MIPRHVAILSFEGPDRYASIGGLGTRVTQLARALGAAGHDVQLFFVGDPHAAPIAVRLDQLPHQREAVLRRELQQQDRQITGNTMAPQEGLAAPIPLTRGCAHLPTARVLVCAR